MPPGRRTKMMISDRVRALVVVLILLGVTTTLAQPPDEVMVTRILDGDTLDVTAAGLTYRIRLIGVGAPERNDVIPCARRWATASAAYLKALVGAGPVRLAFDVVVQDRYARWLAYVYVGEVFVNVAIIDAGLAVVADSGKNKQHRTQLVAAQAAAKTENRGLWAE